ncbi:MAG: glutamate 5-kinase [bacterium]|nr:glutamate 5-kinase [bacterium]
MANRRIVVKLGTNSITKDSGELDLVLISDLVAQIAKLMSEDHDILFVTSGAMGAGRSILNKEMLYDEVTSRQLYAVVGQVKLMEIYSKLFEQHGIIIAQMLATKQDFQNRTHSLNTKNCIESLFREGIIPIMNENDFVCIEELMFTDNDELAGIVCRTLFADTFIILSNVDGVLDENGEVVKEFSYEDDLPAHIISADKSSFGKGGMQTKFNVAKSAARHGTEVFIANSRDGNVLLNIVSGEHIGTRFIPKLHQS